MPRRKRKRAPRGNEWSVSTEIRAEDGRLRFEAYYRAQLMGSVIKDETDFAEMMAALEKPLPVTFRFTKQSDRALTDRFESELQKLTVSATRLEWLNRRAWRLPYDRNSIRKVAELRPLHLWLQGLDEAGEITRQEQVSMVPPLFLEAKPGDFVLDSCAAPGSKSSQIIEELDNDRKDGCLVANDASLPRAHTLVHQIKRLASSRYAVTHCDGRQFPGSALFDRALCDVPCSGDGTARKLPPMLTEWSCSRGSSLHALQTDIAKRAFGLIKPGGRLVYSTCSMNPIENEAVVAALLAAFPHDIELIDASSLAPGLKRRPGLTTWHVFQDSNTPEQNQETALSHENANPTNEKESASTLYGLRELDAVKGYNMRSTVFPPSDPTIAAELVKTMRFLPHDDDSGAFFVAVFLKKISATIEAVSTETEVVTTEPVATNRKPKPEEMRFVELSSVADMDAICDFYGLDDPNFRRDCILTRDIGDGDGSRKAFFVSPCTKNFVTSSRARIVHAGVNVFQRTSQQGAVMPYRLAQEGINLILPYISKRKITCPPQDFALLLKGGSLDFTRLSAAFVERLEPLQTGSFVAVLEYSPSSEGEEKANVQNGDSQPPRPFDQPALVSWRGDSDYISVYCGKTDLAAMCTRVAALQGSTAAAAKIVGTKLVSGADDADDDEKEDMEGAAP